MHFTTRALPEGRAYPLSKGDLSRALGSDLVGSVHFGLALKFRWWGPHRPELPGPVLLTISRSVRDGAWLISVYASPKAEHAPERRAALVRALETTGRDWMRRIENRPETAEIGGERILFCSDGIEIRTVALRSEG